MRANGLEHLLVAMAQIRDTKGGGQIKIGTAFGI